MSNLPSDVLIDILLLLDNLDQLYQVISTCKHTYLTFQERRSLILGRVFEREISRQLQRLQDDFLVSTSGTPGRVYITCVEKLIRYVNLVIGGCHNVDDVLALDAAVWRAMTAFTCSPGLIGSFGLQSISRCILVDRKNTAIIHTREIVELVIRSDALQVDKATGRIRNNSVKNMIVQLSNLLIAAGLTQEANDTMVQLHEATPVFYDRDFFNILLASSRHSETATKALIPLCQSRVDQGRAIDTSESHLRRNSTPMAYHLRWVRCLIAVRLELERFEDAVDAFTNLSRFPVHARAQHDSIYVNLAHYLIKYLKRSGLQDHTLTVHRHVLEYFQGLQQIDDNLHAASVKEYAAQLSQMGQYREALATLGQLWGNSRQQTDEHKTETMEYYLQNMAWTLGHNHEQLAYSNETSDIHNRYERSASISLVTV